jgi:hypothetical protein
VQWAGTQPRIPSELMAFLMFRKPLISTFDPEVTDPAFATPRSWEKVAHYDTNPRMPEDIKDASIEGAVGEGPAAEYAGFKKVIKDMPSMKDIEANPTTVSVSDKPEVRWAVAVGIAGELAQRPVSSGAYQQYLDRMDPEFGILAWQLGSSATSSSSARKEFIHISRVHQAIFASVNRG